ncbi:MAG TPA: diaminopimelate decarboxylase, partial [Chromatiaceae bacterium]|nr:diaminopimelate decarboxylase [Chromatiaceae bacterium]
MDLVEGRWKIGSISVCGLADQHGTPLYIYDSQAIRRQVKRFREAFSAFDHRIYYAMKANSNPDLLMLMN